MVLRFATLADVELLVRHRRGMFEAMGGSTPEGLAMHDGAYRAWAEERLLTGQLVAWVAEDAEGPLASGVLWLQPVQPSPTWIGGTRPYLMSMYTEPHARGKGLATLIAHAALDWARARGFPMLALHASEMGRPIYERMGFERTWEMKKRL